ncbi:MAG: glycosyltransferase family 4 protein [Nitrospirota bacterium]|nr:glycosyltransferase family 4 protein [Nitrospirota bacterium]MDP2382732.1 glycosyltransferase family 4 protein [Nitrospirota bacterium]MDP3596464.1 glycosyltransferase family 4 protein [Nitrospirota bacterium]
MISEANHSASRPSEGQRPRKYNLLIVVSNLWIGGTEVVIQNLCHTLDRSLFNVSVCHLKERGNIGDDLHRAGVDIVGVPSSKFFKRANYFSFLELLKVIRSKEIDIIHSHTTYSLTDSALSKLFCPSVKLVHTFHFGNYPHDDKRRMLMERIFSKVADCLVAVGDHQRKTIEQAYGVSSTKMRKIWNGVTLSDGGEAFDLQSVIGTEKRLVVGTIATLYEQKGITFLLDVAARLKSQGEKVAFIVAGEGPLRKELEQKCERLGLSDTVYLIGWVKDAAARLIPKLDVFFQPSLWEAMSVVVLEAMAAGKPIVVTRVGENPLVIGHDRDGLLVDPRNIDQMVSALSRLIHEPGLGARLGDEAKKTFYQSFTADRMARDYERLYLEVLG